MIVHGKIVANSNLERERERGMGGCVSTPKSCVGSKLRSSKPRKSRKRRRKRAAAAAASSSSRLSDGSFDHPRNNLPTPTFRGFNPSLFWFGRFVCESSKVLSFLLRCLIWINGFFSNASFIIVSESLRLDSHYRAAVL